MPLNMIHTFDYLDIKKKPLCVQLNINSISNLNLLYFQITIYFTSLCKYQKFFRLLIFFRFQ